MDMHEHIRQSNLIEGIDDPVADLVGRVAWLWLDRQLRIDEERVRTLHLLVTAAQPDLADNERGSWRRHAVRVGDYVPPTDYGIIAELMTSWVFRLQCALRGSRPDDTPKNMHIEFEKIHPFVDGNGRVGRMLMWWHEMQVRIEPTLVHSDRRRAYYEWFR